MRVAKSPLAAASKYVYSVNRGFGSARIFCFLLLGPFAMDRFLLLTLGGMVHSDLLLNLVTCTCDVMWWVLLILMHASFGIGAYSGKQCRVFQATSDTIFAGFVIFYVLARTLGRGENGIYTYIRTY